MSRYGASTFSSLLKDCVLWAPLQHSAGVSGDVDEFPIIPSGVTVTNNGTFTKMSLGNNRSVLNFDGSTNYISLSNHANITMDRLDPFTICFWIYGTNSTTQYGPFNKSSASAPWTGWGIAINNAGISGRVALYLTATWPSSAILTHFTQSIANAWHHIAITYDGSSNASGVNMYCDGDLKSKTSEVDKLTTSLAYTGAGYIGAGNASGAYTSGALKDLMIYKGRVLTQPEIKLLMNRTHPITGAGLMPVNGEYYKLS